MNKKYSEIVYIYQSDVDSGTFRIKKGGYYMLAENICFDPIPGSEREDKPKFGWFAVISIETKEPVTLNLNTYSIECSQRFVDTHYSKAFGIIVLNNTIYGARTISPILRGFNYTNETELLDAENVVIKNGRLGRSPHFGIKGFYNINIDVHDLVIEDFELTGIWISAYKNIIYRNICISGNKHPIRVSTRLSSLFFLQILLGDLASGGFPGAQAQLTIVNRLFTERVKLEFENFVIEPTHTMYGIILVNGLRATFPTILPKTTPAPPAPQFSCPVIAARSGVDPTIYPSSNVKLHNITIKNLKNNPIEEIVTAYGAEPGVVFPPFSVQGRAIPTIIYGLFGPIPWKELFGEGPTPCVNGTITNVSLSEFARALLFSIFAVQSLPQPAPPAPPRPNILAPDFLTNILFNNTLLANRVQPAFGSTSSLDTKRGIFGIAIYCSSDIEMQNITIDNIICRGFPNIVPNSRTVPGLSCYSDTVFAPQDEGGKSWGILVDASDNVNICNSKISDVVAFTSDAFGVHFAETVTDSHVNNICVNNIISKFDIGNETEFNPPSVSYGMQIEINSTGNSVSNSTFKNIIAPRTAIGVEIDNNSSHNTIYNSTADKIIANSKLLFIGGSTTVPTIEDVAKTATGFVSKHSIYSTFECAEAKNIIIANESFCDTGPSTSRAAGIALLDRDRGATIICPKVSHLIAGSGTAEKIYVDANITNYEITNEDCECRCPYGY